MGANESSRRALLKTVVFRRNPLVITHFLLELSFFFLHIIFNLLRPVVYGYIAFCPTAPSYCRKLFLCSIACTRHLLQIFLLTQFVIYSRELPLSDKVLVGANLFRRKNILEEYFTSIKPHWWYRLANSSFLS